MANQFYDVKSSIPNVGERAYIFSKRVNEVIGHAQVPPNPTGDPCLPIDYNAGAGSLLSRQCHYFKKEAWDVGNELENIYPTVGQFVRIEIFDPNGVSYGPQWITCDRVVEIVDEATFNTGTCISCFNQGAAGTCSNTFGPNPDPLGCFYDNHINPQGIVVEGFATAPTDSVVTTIVDTCAECWGLAIPNGIKSCCDPTIQYTLPINNFLFTSNSMVYVGSALVGDFMFPAGSTPPTTEYGCWEVVSDAVGPLVGTLGAGVILAFPDCYNIDLTHPYAEIDSCCPPTTTECDPSPLQPLINRLTNFKKDRAMLLNEGGTYTKKSIEDLNDLGKGNITQNSGGGSGGSGRDDSRWSCEMGRCSVDPYGRFESREACIANCESGGGGDEVPSQCCEWCCHQNREDYILPQGCYDWMCDSCNCNPIY